MNTQFRKEIQVVLNIIKMFNFINDMRSGLKQHEIPFFTFQIENKSLQHTLLMGKTSSYTLLLGTAN